MKKSNTKKPWLKILLTTVGILLIAIIFIPLFIPVQSATGLAEPMDMVNENSNLINIEFVGTDGINLYSTQRTNLDSDRNFILLHGSLYNSNTWNLIIDDLSALGNVYAYDQIPYGYSEKLLEEDWSASNPYTTKAAIEQLGAYIEALELDNAVLVGSSFGGVIAADFAATYPEKVDALILVDPAIMITESMPSWLVESPQAEHLGPILAKSLAAGDGFYKSTYYDLKKMTEERLNLSKSETEINNWDLALWEYLQAWSTEPSDISTRLTDINTPTLVISGSEDTIVPLEQSQEIAKLIPNASISIIEECGHLPHEEKPGEFMDIVNQWIEEIKGD